MDTAGRLTGSRRRAAEAALAIIDAEGLDALSIRRLAEAVGIRGASLYHHFRDKDEILDAVATLALSELRPEDDDADGRRPSETTADWIEWLVAMARSYRQALLAHPNLVPLILGRYNRRAGAATYDYASARLTRAGVPPAYQVTIINALEAYATGSVLYGLNAPASAWRAELPDEGYDHLRLALETDALDEEERFELCCRALLQGLAVHLDRVDAAP